MGDRAVVRHVRRVAGRARRSLARLQGSVRTDSMAALPTSARAKVRLMQMWRALPFTKPTMFTLRPAPGCVVTAHTDTMAIDVVTLDYVVRRVLFDASSAGRVVVDIGAHKGYFGTIALLDGASAVYSYEPEPMN